MERTRLATVLGGGAIKAIAFNGEGNLPRRMTSKSSSVTKVRADFDLAGDWQTKVATFVSQMMLAIVTDLQLKTQYVSRSTEEYLKSQRSQARKRGLLRSYSFSPPGLDRNDVDGENARWRLSMSESQRPHISAEV